MSAVLGGCSGPAAPPPGSGKSSNPATLYAKYCAGCHGADGRRGSGNMVLIHAGRLSDAEVEQVIAAGREGMPSWKDRLSATEIAALARYVRQFK